MRFLPAGLQSLRTPTAVWALILPIWAALAAASEFTAPAASHLWVMPLLAASVPLLVVPLRLTLIVRVVSLIAAIVCALFWMRDSLDLYLFIVPLMGRLRIVTPFWLYPAYIAFVGIMLAPPIVAALAGAIRGRLAQTADRRIAAAGPGDHHGPVIRRGRVHARPPAPPRRALRPRRRPRPGLVGHRRQRARTRPRAAASGGRAVAIAAGRRDRSRGRQRQSADSAARTALRLPRIRAARAGPSRRGGDVRVEGRRDTVRNHHRAETGEHVREHRAAGGRGADAGEPVRQARAPIESLDRAFRGHSGVRHRVPRDGARGAGEPACRRRW